MNKEHNIFVTMGASNHTEEEREKNEFYATNPIFINHLLEREPWLKDKDLKILEPSAGDGTLVDRFYELTGNKMDAYDIISRRDDIIEQNYFTKNFSDQYDVILTNPPYLKDTLKTTEGLADYILKALKEVKINGSVIMFLKTLHLESKVRYEIQNNIKRLVQEKASVEKIKEIIGQKEEYKNYEQYIDGWIGYWVTSLNPQIKSILNKSINRNEEQEEIETKIKESNEEIFELYKEQIQNDIKERKEEKKRKEGSKEEER